MTYDGVNVRFFRNGVAGNFRCWLRSMRSPAVLWTCLSVSFGTDFTPTLVLLCLQARCGSCPAQSRAALCPPSSAIRSVRPSSLASFCIPPRCCQLRLRFSSCPFLRCISPRILICCSLPCRAVSQHPTARTNALQCALLDEVRIYNRSARFCQHFLTSTDLPISLSACAVWFTAC